MNYRVLTVSREFGSGGGRVAKAVADALGWKLLDSALIEAIACASHVEPGVVSSYDEHVEGWLARMNRHAMRGAALAAGVVPDAKTCFDPDIMAELTRQIVEQAYTDGNCVIVGRGAQCILQRRRDAYHVYVYAPLQDRIQRLRTRLGPGVNIEERIRAVDEERAHYMKLRFAKAWNNPHLYDLLISSCEGEEATARVILYAMTGRSAEDSRSLADRSAATVS
ncbi:MAG TPA: cytidylate kinase-like family protein [Terracidiphilus sp.]|nr:cytidylate kinase-like family protein [Terracidiphilus sp.]